MASWSNFIFKRVKLKCLKISLHQIKHDVDSEWSYELCILLYYSSIICVLRATAFGVLNGTCKLAAIISTFTFGKFIGITKIIPIFLSFSALVCGGLLAFKLPETREVVLQWKSQTPQGLSVWSSWTLNDCWTLTAEELKHGVMLEPLYRSITVIVLLLSN